MLYEDKALEKHPQAREFRPVMRPWSNNLYGWTFEFPASEGSAVKRYGWVTHDAEVSSDNLQDREHAKKNLRTYVRTRPVGKPFGRAPLT